MYNDTKFVISNKLGYRSNAFVHGFANCGNKNPNCSHCLRHKTICQSNTMAITVRNKCSYILQRSKLNYPTWK